MKIKEQWSEVLEETSISTMNDSRFIATVGTRRGYEGKGSTKKEALLELILKIAKDDASFHKSYYRQIKGLFLELLFKSLIKELNHRGMNADYPIRLKGRAEIYKIFMPERALVFLQRHSEDFSLT